MNDKVKVVPMPKADNTITKKQLSARIGVFANNQKAHNEDGQQILLLIYRRAHKHGDYSQANELLTAAEGMNRTHLTNHMRTYGGLKTMADFSEAEQKVLRENPANEGKFIFGWNGKAYIKANFEKALANKWWTPAKKDAEFMGANLDQMIATVLNKFDKANKKAIGFREEGQIAKADLVSCHVQKGTIERLLNAMPLEAEIVDLLQERAKKVA